LENISTRDVDLIIRGEKDWIIEVKREYSAGKFDTALGQVIVSDELYKTDNDLEEEDTQRAVVFGQLKSAVSNSAKRRVFGRIVEIAHQNNVRIYAGVDDGEFREVTEHNYNEFPTGHWDE